MLRIRVRVLDLLPQGPRLIVHSEPCLGRPAGHRWPVTPPLQLILNPHILQLTLLLLPVLAECRYLLCEEKVHNPILNDDGEDEVDEDKGEERELEVEIFWNIQFKKFPDEICGPENNIDRE